MGTAKNVRNCYMWARLEGDSIEFGCICSGYRVQKEINRSKNDLIGSIVNYYFFLYFVFWQNNMYIMLDKRWKLGDCKHPYCRLRKHLAYVSIISIGPIKCRIYVQTVGIWWVYLVMAPPQWYGWYSSLPPPRTPHPSLLTEDFLTPSVFLHVILIIAVFMSVISRRCWKNFDRLDFVSFGDSERKENISARACDAELNNATSTYSNVIHLLV